MFQQRKVRWLGGCAGAVCCLALFLSGCGTGGGDTGAAGGAAGGGGPAASSQLVNTPATMQVFQAGAGISDTEFKQLIAEPVKKKYPNITLELVRQAKDITPESLLAAGQYPDLSFIDSLNLNNFLDLNLLADMAPLAKKYNLDVNQFEKRSIDEIKRFGDQGQLYAIPFSINFGGLFYNKDIFNKTGIGYPVDGMSWEDVIEVAKKLAARDPDISGVGYDGINRIAISLRVPFVNSKTNRAELNTPDWKYTLGLFKALSDIPDNKKVKAAKNGFEVDQKSAMLVSYGARVGEMQELADSGKSFDWDLTTFPFRKDAQVQGMETESHVLALSSTAKNKDAAFQIIQFLSTNDELQSMVARNARISPLKDDKYKKLFGADLKALQGKNIQSIFKNKFGPNARPTRYDEQVKPSITDALKKVNAGTDINTALREAEQSANQAIDTAKQGGK